jgi:hypothetical protein
MTLAGAEPVQAGSMFGGAVTFVPGESVLGVKPINGNHHAIAADLRQY